jgi:hypothetical protein
MMRRLTIAAAGCAAGFAAGFAAGAGFMAFRMGADEETELEQWQDLPRS